MILRVWVYQRNRWWFCCHAAGQIELSKIRAAYRQAGYATAVEKIDMRRLRMQDAWEAMQHGLAN